MNKLQDGSKNLDLLKTKPFMLLMVDYTLRFMFPSRSIPVSVGVTFLSSCCCKESIFTEHLARRTGVGVKIMLVGIVVFRDLSLSDTKYRERTTFHAHDDPRPVIAFSLDRQWCQGGKRSYAPEGNVPS